MVKEYIMKKGMVPAEFLDILENLRDDARDNAVPLSMFFTQYGDREKQAEAMYYIGQMDLIKSLLWALSGEAENDGIDEPTVSIR